MAESRRWDTLATPRANFAPGFHVRCPHCATPVALAPDSELRSINCSTCGSTFSLTSETADGLAAQQVIRVGHFQLVERVGMGAFGSVWKAIDTELDRTVAVKMPRQGQLDEQHAQAFLKEARSAAQLRHPNIVPVHEVGREGSVLYIVSDFVHGITLSDWLNGQQPTCREAAEIGAKIGDALHHAHERGVIHRDLKPGNIMLDGDGQPHIMDFGLARREFGEVTVTVDGNVLGTPAYMSPEQATGKAHSADRRSDVYSLGVILFQLLTGEVPFRGNIRMILHQVIHDEPPSPRKFNANVPKDYETIVIKCLQKEPARRFDSAQLLADELQRCIRGDPIHSRPISNAERAWRWCRRHPTLSVLTSLVVAISAVALSVVTWQWLTIRQAEYDRTISQASELLTASPEAVPNILQNLQPRRAEVIPQLRQMLDREDLGEKERQRVRLALLAEDPSQTQELVDGLFTADTREFVLLRDLLFAEGLPKVEPMWTTLEDADRAAGERFRAGVFLAADEQASADRWRSRANFIATHLVSTLVANPGDYGVWVDALRPMREELLAPLTSIARDASRPDREQDVVAHILADYAADRPEVLTGLLLDSRPAQFSVFLSVLSKSEHRAQAKFQLLNAFGSAAAAGDSSTELDDRAKRRANAAIALVQLGGFDQLGALLEETADPSARSYFINRFQATGSKTDALVALVNKQLSAPIRRAAYLTLGTFSAEELAHTSELSNKGLLATYEDDPDPGIHSAVRWVLTKWGHRDAADRADSKLRTTGGNVALTTRRWFVDSHGHTMLVHGPGEFLMGWPEDEPGGLPGEQRHHRRIDRTFAIAACETTNAQFRRFRPEHSSSGALDCPVDYISWSDAAGYCNWLSAQVGIPEDQWCYEVTDAGQGQMQPAENCLARQGYRLPTEAEWEYVCRAGSTTARFFGHSVDLLPEYAWCPRNSPEGDKQSVALKKPNDAGLFDVYGNALEWCHDYAGDYPSDDEMHLDEGGPRESAKGYRVMRGSAAGDLAPARSALRDRSPQFAEGIYAAGFRVAKTVKVESEVGP